MTTERDRRGVVLALFCGFLLLAPAAGLADGVAASSREGGAERSNDVRLPFAFFNDLFGFAGGYSWARGAYPQPQSSILLSAMAGTAGSGMLYASGRDLLVPGFERLFADPLLILGYFHGNYAYVDGNPRYRSERAGSNGSAHGDYLAGDGWDNFLRVSFRYLLPIGWGRDHVLPEHRRARGRLAAGAGGGASLNPFTSGKTFLAARPFYASQTLHASGFTEEQKTNGVDLMLNWDNRDDWMDPSLGQSLTLRWSRDFGWLGSTSRWTVVAGELDQYLSLGESEHFRQRVIALDVWIATSPSWEERAAGTVDQRPPTYTGATLGGWWRMRGYRIGRFSDAAAVYYSAEYRLTPRWNPFDASRRLQDLLGVEWIQLAPFAELGRVGPSFDLGELHSAMKWDLGLGFRFLARTTLVRIDVAGSNEGGAVQMMVEQPFQF